MRLVVLSTWAGAVALFAVAAPAVAQQTATSSKIGYVDTRAILQQTPGYAKAESTYKKEVEVYQGEVQKLRLGLDSAANEFEQQSVMLSPTQRATKRKALEDQQQKGEQRAQELQQKIVARERELLEPLQLKINAVIEGLRAAGNYALIFDIGAPNSGIVTADRSLDLTEKVIQQLKSGS